MKNIIFIAPPAAGKGTFAQMLKDKYSIPHISTGDLLRKEIKDETEIGLQVKSVIDAGKLVSDEIVFNLLIKRLKETDCDQGFILDGFPRNEAQAIELEKISSEINREIKYVIFLDVSKEVAGQRILGRVSCPNCSEVYNLYTSNFKEEGKCNKCSTLLVRRDDDNEETFNKRYDTYLEQTKPVIDYYKNKGLLFVIDSNSNDKELKLQQIEAIINEENND